MKKNIKIVALVVCLVIGIVIGFKLGGIGINGTKDITLNTVSEILEPASELITVKYSYEQFDIYENAKELNIGDSNFKIPFTEDKTVFTYAGTVSVGYDLNKITYKIDNNRKEITVTLPEAKIIAHETEEDKFNEYIIKDSIFTKTTWNDYNKTVSELKKKQEEKILEDKSFIEQVRKNGEQVIAGFLKSSDQTMDYKVIFNN